MSALLSQIFRIKNIDSTSTATDDDLIMLPHIYVGFFSSSFLCILILLMQKDTNSIFPTILDVPVPVSKIKIKYITKKVNSNNKHLNNF